MKTATAILLALVLLVCGWAAQKSWSFSPNDLVGMKIVYDGACRPWYCAIVTDGEKSYLVVLEGKQVVFIYEVIVGEEMKLGDLLYARDLI